LTCNSDQSIPINRWSTNIALRNSKQGYIHFVPKQIYTTEKSNK